MKKYVVEISETAEQDLENIISYLRFSLAGDIIADKYKILFKQELKNLENIAGSMPILSEDLTGHKNIRKTNVRNYIVFYIVVFVTHNTGKIKSAEKYFKNLKFTTFNYELDEPRSDDIKEIATAKVKEAFEIVKRPCIALDTDFRIDELNGFPRAFVNFSLDTIGIEGILKLMEGKENRKCAFNECLAYHDGKNIHYFYGRHPRKLIK